MRETQGWEKNREGKKKEGKGKKRKERKKERRKRKKRKKKGRGRMAGHGLADGRRRRPEVTGEGGQSSKNLSQGGASVVQKGKMEFCKRGFRERRVGLLERARRGEEDGVVGGDQGGVRGGGDSGEDNGGSRFLGGKRGRRRR